MSAKRYGFATVKDSSNDGEHRTARVQEYVLSTDYDALEAEWNKWVLLNKGWITERAALLAVLRRCAETLDDLHRGHDYVDGDCWYSCPKHHEYCGDKDRTICECGADKVNAIIDAALAAAWAWLEETP